MPTSERRTNRVTTVGIYVAAGLWILVPIIAVWVLWGQAGEATLAVQRSTWVEVGEPPQSVSSDADLELTWSEQTSLVAPAWAGVVQSVSVVPGESIVNGTEIAVIDNISRIAWHTTVPLFRPIAWGDSGDDVAALNAFLRAQGLSHDSGSDAYWATVQGIRQYAGRIGAGDISVFDPAWLIFLPRDVVVKGVSDLAIGSPTPPAGTTIVEGTVTLEAATLVEPLPLGSEAAGTTIEPVVLAENQRVTLASKVVGVSENSTVDSPDDIDVLEQHVTPGQSRIRVKIITDIPQGVVAIPYGAISERASGACVAVRRGTEFEVVSVQVEYSGAGRVYVVGELAVGDEVLVPPGEIQCASTNP